MNIAFQIVSLFFEVSYQIVSVWGNITIAFYLLSEFSLHGEEVTAIEKKRILKNALFFCVLLALWMLCMNSANIKPYVAMHNTTYFKCISAVARFNKSNPEVFSEFSPTETVDITDRLDISLSNARVILKNKKYSLKYDIKNCYFRKKGVPSIGFGAYSGMTLDNYKKELSLNYNNYNSPDLDSPYDGIGDVYYINIIGLSK
jgi:hypothetical protein